MSNGPCIVDASVLTHALGYLPKIKKTPSFPILEHARIDAPDGWLRLATTDLNVSLVQEVRRIDGEPMEAVTAPTRLLVAVLGKLRAGRVSFTRGSEAQVVIETGAGRTAMLGLPAASFPKLPAPGPLGSLRVVYGPEFAEALAFVITVASSDDMRPHLCGVYFDTDRLVATDGHRLHLAPCVRLEGREEPPCLIPLDAAKLVAKFARSGSPFAFSLSGVTQHEDLDRRTATDFWMDRAAAQHRVALHVKLPNVLFPPIERVIPPPDRASLRVHVNGPELVTALRAVRSPTWAAKVTVHDGRLTFESENIDEGTTRTSEVACTLDGAMGTEAFVFGINTKYLTDAVTGCERATLGLAGNDQSPVRIDRDDGMLAIVMPMRI